MTIINELVVIDISESIKFYENIFGFEVECSEGKPVYWVLMKKDNQKIMFEDYSHVKNEICDYPLKSDTSNIIKFEFNDKSSFDKIYDNCQNNGCTFFQGYHTTDYGKVEFGIYDLDKNIIIVSYIK